MMLEGFLSVTSINPSIRRVIMAGSNFSSPSEQCGSLGHSVKATITRRYTAASVSQHREQARSALQEGCPEAGVSVAFTVRAMDAGAVLAQHRRPMPPDTQAPHLLAELFDEGAQLLLEHLPKVWTGEAATLATPQVHRGPPPHIMFSARSDFVSTLLSATTTAATDKSL